MLRHENPGTTLWANAAEIGNSAVSINLVTPQDGKWKFLLAVEKISIQAGQYVNICSFLLSFVCLCNVHVGLPLRLGVLFLLPLLVSTSQSENEVKSGLFLHVFKQ